MNLTKSTRIAPLIGGDYRLNGEVKRDDPFSVGSNSVRAYVGGNFRRTNSRDRDVCNAQTMKQPGL